MNNKSRRFHLSTLTVIAISITAVIAVVICITFFLTVYSRTLINDATLTAEQSVQQTSIAVKNYLDGLKSKLDKISGEIADSADTGEVASRISLAARLESDIEAIVVYDGEGKVLACGADGQTLKTNPAHNLSYSDELFAQSEDYAVSRPHVQTLFEEYYPWVVTIVHSEYQPLFGEKVYVAIDFSFSGLAEYVDNIGIGSHGYCYIQDSSGNIVYHPRQQMIFSGLMKENLQDAATMTDGVHIGDNAIKAIYSMPEGNWRIVGVSYIDELNAARAHTVVRVVLFSFLCVALVAVLVLLLLSRIVAKPVRVLAKAMKDFESCADKYRYNPTDNRVAELQILSDSFGHMVGMVQELMERVRREEITLRKTELRALQAQINPHFLYNTLDSIQWMCEQGKNESAVKMVSALARLFRISISRGHELITIQDELRHAESYLIIQSYRYKNQFSYHFDVDESVSDCLCNKITIQPLVENAIYHGIDRMVDEGEITISVQKAEDGDILICVEDNGVGMTEQQCKSILQKERSDSGGIGIKNVNDRLKIYFGDKYGIHIESELDVGTKIIVRIPQIRKEPENEV